MPTAPSSRCPTCHRLHRGKGRCDACRASAEQASDAKRGGARTRGYDAEHETRFRAGVLRRDPRCTCQADDHVHSLGHCHAPSTVADHWPLSRRQLVARGLDSNDPAYGRGLCKPCHDAHTARAQPGGWNQGGRGVFRYGA